MERQKMEKFKIGDHVEFGKSSIGVYRGIDNQGLAKVEIGLNCLVNPPQPMVAIVPLDELTLDE